MYLHHYNILLNISPYNINSFPFKYIFLLIYWYISIYTVTLSVNLDKKYHDFRLQWGLYLMNKCKWYRFEMHHNILSAAVGSSMIYWDIYGSRKTACATLVWVRNGTWYRVLRMIGNKVKMNAYDNDKLQYTRMMIMDSLGSI